MNRGTTSTLCPPPPCPSSWAQLALRYSQLGGGAAGKQLSINSAEMQPALRLTDREAVYNTSQREMQPALWWNDREWLCSASERKAASSGVEQLESDKSNTPERDGNS